MMSSITTHMINLLGLICRQCTSYDLFSADATASMGSTTALPQSQPGLGGVAGVIELTLMHMMGAYHWCLFFVSCVMIWCFNKEDDIDILWIDGLLHIPLSYWILLISSDYLVSVLGRPDQKTHHTHFRSHPICWQWILSCNEGYWGIVQR